MVDVFAQLQDYATGFHNGKYAGEKETARLWRFVVI